MLSLLPNSPPYPLYTQALHTNRINLSPFTKDFRVWGALNENQPISRVGQDVSHCYHGLVPSTHILTKKPTSLAPVKD